MIPDDPSTQVRSETTLDGLDAMPQSPVDAPFPIVGIAASAGGLEAFTQLLSHLPLDTGMAFVLIQHLAPDHESMLTEILSRATPLPVREVQNGTIVERNHVYVIPPNTKMILSGGVLQLSPREKVLGKYMPGDAFFTSLAADRGHKAIAVVLSGGDGDGSLGVTAIKAAGGITFAQCEETAKFDGMPHTAVATGHVDFVLPPAQIAEALANLSRNPRLVDPVPLLNMEVAPQPGEALTHIFALLRASTGVDFSRYKLNTIERRMQRRMLLYKLEQLDDYATYLQAHPAEVKALYAEILIHVTSFFRDPEAFDLLKTRVFPTLVQNKSAVAPIRIWVAGCSTGEEVYSIAICLLEFLADQATVLPIQIFATDISEQAINKARAGVYQENQMVTVTAERRRRFFYALEGGSYQISKAVRELCVFARQNLGSDPPFSNLDLISCRNVLIYLGDALQKRIMPIFHYSLNPTGFLLLGTSEGTGQASDLFTLIEKKYRIYTKKLTDTRPTFAFTPSRHSIARVSELPLPAPSEAFDLEKKVGQLIANHYVPVGVVIDDQMQVLQLRGGIDRYLKLVSGVANLNLFNLVRDGLLVELRTAIHQAQQQGVPCRKDGLRLEEGDHARLVKLQVLPFKVPTAEAYHFLVLFEDAPPATSPALMGPARPQVALEQEIAQLRQERATTQEYLQAVIQEQEGSNQDLKVANEEILSSNEELQSTNEELETAKEEIQATNEELSTTNEELRSRNAEMHQVNNDLTNLLASINIPILMLTNDLRIRRFTPMAQQLFNFIPTDAGRPLSDIRANLNVPDLELLLLEVLETLSVKELEVQTQDGHWYLLRMRPYRTTENQIDGVVLVLMDIDALKRSAATLEAARNYAEAIVETVQVPLVVLESDLRVNTANQAFYDTFQVAPLETAQTLLFELGNGQWNLPGLRSRLEAVVTGKATLQNFVVEHEFEQLGLKTILLQAVPLVEGGETHRLLLSLEDITARQQVARLSEQLNLELEQQVQERTAQLQQALAFEAGLKRITDKVRDSLDESQILQTAVQELALVLGLSGCYTTLYDSGLATSTVCSTVTQVAVEGLACTLAAVGQRLDMAVVPETYHQRLQGDYLQFCALASPSSGQCAQLVCPIADDQDPLGDLWLLKPPQSVFNELEIRLVQQVANQCAIAMRQARLYQTSQTQIQTLQKLDQLKDNFLSTTSHELRSPVTNMRMAIRLLKLALAPATATTKVAKAGVVEQYLQILEMECEREISLINNLLDLQRLEAGDQPLVLAPIELQDWLPTVLAPFYERAREHQQTFQVNYAPDLPRLVSDAAILEQLCAELFHNACKYTPKQGQITVTVQTQQDTLQIQISNPSVTLAADELAHIFDKFYRIPNADPWRQGGTGLGLALVQKQVEHLGGTIAVEQTADQLHFLVTLPLRTGQTVL